MLISKIIALANKKSNQAKRATIWTVFLGCCTIKKSQKLLHQRIKKQSSQKSDDMDCISGLLQINSLYLHFLSLRDLCQRTIAHPKIKMQFQILPVLPLFLKRTQQTKQSVRLLFQRVYGQTMKIIEFLFGEVADTSLKSLKRSNT